MFLCSFLLLMFTGTLTYVYLLWNTYWDRVAKITRDYRYHQRAFLKHPAQAVKGGLLKGRNKNKQPSLQTGSTIGSVEGHLAANLTTTQTPFNLRDLPLDKLLHHIKHYKRQIMDQLESAVSETGKTVLFGKVENLYHVTYPPAISSNRVDRPKEQLLCEALKINTSTFLSGNPFFENQQLGSYLPSKPLSLIAQESPKHARYNSCAVVSSAGSLLHSNLGSHIDSNDFVIRFNNAPTLGYEKDVGNKTSLRIVNSQVVGKPKFGFLDGGLYGGQPVLVWDPCSYNSTLHDWYRSPDFPFFETYFAKRLMQRDTDVHLLDPRVLWDMWRWLQSQFDTPILPNPPSSGFLGVVLALRSCARVNVYEYVPSMRLTKRCHYYDTQENLGCTIGDWHPLAAEKLVTLKLNSANDTTVFSDGYVSIKGFLSTRKKAAKCKMKIP